MTTRNCIGHPPELTISILIATFKRPADLGRLLDSIQPEVVGKSVNVVVIDNDPNGTAETTVREHPLGAFYEIEDTPGIAAARNKAIKSAISSKYFIFVDDDEVVSKGWLDALTNTAVQYGSDMVAGPVLSLLPESTPAWVERSGLFVRDRHSTGTERPDAGSGNLLVRAELFASRPSNAWFNLSYGLSGGSDAELTRRFVSAGHRIVWCDEAIASETVPAERCTFRWLVRRQKRLASVDFRLMKGRARRSRAILGGSVRMVVGSLRLSVGALSGGVDGGAFRTLFRGVGFIQAGLGRQIVEYKR